MLGCPREQGLLEQALRLSIQLGRSDAAEDYARRLLFLDTRRAMAS